MSIPMIRVVIIVTVNGTPDVLMDGVMTHDQVTPGDEAAQAPLTITGEDLSRGDGPSATAAACRFRRCRLNARVDG